MQLNDLEAGHAFKYPAEEDGDPILMAIKVSNIVIPEFCQITLNPVPVLMNPSTLVKPVCMIEEFDSGITEIEDRLLPLSEVASGQVFQVHNQQTGLIRNYCATDGCAVSGRVVLDLNLPSTMGAETEVFDCGYAGHWFSPGVDK